MMKKSLYSLLLFTVITAFAQEQEKLPIQPWEEIVEINSNKNVPFNKWNTDINIGLLGNYSIKDSLAIAKAVKKLNSITESISVTFSNEKSSNLKIVFFDSIVTAIAPRTNLSNWRLIHEGNVKSKIKSGIIYVYETDRKPQMIEHFFEPKIARILLQGQFTNPRSDKKRESIFNPYYRHLNNRNKPLNQGDMDIIREVYRTGFEDRLIKAEGKFKEVYEKLEKDKAINRDIKLWWVKNPISVLILPTLLLALAFGLIIKKINKNIASKIKKEWLRFGVIALMALLFVDILIVFWVSFYDFLTIPFNKRIFHVIRKDTLLTTTAFIVIIYPFLFLLRFIELKISKSSQQVYTKTGLIFISTGFLPFLIYLLIIYLASEIRDNNNLYGLSLAFVFLMVIASIRALISYFIFKERHLIIENETKLSRLRELKVKAELKSLHSQINPHFLYNSLNSIASLAPIDAKKTQDMAHSLSDLFKYSINRKGQKTSTIKDEVEMVKTYLDIEKIRFGERLKFNVNVDETVENHGIPLFLIQPLVENAVKHGISKQAGQGSVDLTIKSVGEDIHITVSDSGPDFPEGLVSGHGLQTVFDLLRLSYNDKASLNWSNSPRKEITITIPKAL